MNKIIALLVAGCSFSFAHADNNVITHESFLKHKARFEAERPKKECVENLKPELITPDTFKVKYGSQRPNEEALYGRDLPIIKFESAQGKAFVLDPTDMSSDPSTILKVVKLIKREKSNDYIVKIRKYGLLKFHYRMLNLQMRGEKFDNLGELKEYCELLAYSMKDIFYNNPEGQNPVADTFQHFATEDPNFRSLEHYQLLSAALSGIDLAKAMQADPYFYIYIQQWFQANHGSRSLSSVSDEKIEQKIRQIAPHYSQLDRLVSKQN